MTERHQIEMILRAAQPIAHAEGTVGNAQVAMRRKVRLADGRWTRVPYITGDTMRHGVREAGAYALLEAASLLESPVLSEAALRLLFAGGMVMGSAADVVRMDEERAMRETIPILPLLGGCVGNRIVPGKLEVGDAWLVCDETSHIVPRWVSEWMAEEEIEQSGARAHVEMVQRVRMDPMLTPSKRLLLKASDDARVEQRLLDSELASERGDAKATKAAKATMMPFTYETIAAGSLFYWRIDAVTHSEIERDTLYVMLAAFLAKARVGGKKGTGHGLLEPIHARGINRQASEPVAPDALALTVDARAPEIARFRAHVGSRRDAVRDWLSGVTS